MSKKNFDDLIDSSTHAHEDGAIKNIIGEPARDDTAPGGIVVEHLNKPIIKPNMLSSEEVEKVTGLSDKTIAKYLRIGRIKAVKIGTKWQIHPDDLNEFLAGKVDDEWMAKCVEREAERKARRKPREPKAKAVEV
ncbi:MAG: helix-turn-helix domain-containing protein [Fibrobacter sp.]|nr:helix-turn-helix domain-containing protein [Fibrobacter sp.]